MEYLVMIRNVEKTPDGSVELRSVPLAKFNYPFKAISVGDIIHLGKDMMFDGLEQTAIRVNEIEHVMDAELCIIGASTDTTTQLTGIANGEKISIDVPSFGEIIKDSGGAGFSDKELQLRMLSALKDVTYISPELQPIP